MLIKNGLVLQGKEFQRKSLKVQDDLIVEIGEEISDDVIIEADDLYVIPGLIDIHLHGCVGYDFCDGTTEAMAAMAEYELQNGVTSIVPTSMTYAEDRLTEIFKTAAAYKKFPKAKDMQQAEIIGINMEGPFIAKAKCGAQNPECIQKPDVGMFERLQKAAEGLVKLVDIAPEEDDGFKFIKALHDNVHISLAHTASDYDTAKAAIDLGADHVTHLYNAMNPLLHRSPGVIGAASESDKVMAEMIVDGIHVHPSAVRSALKLFGEDRIVFISDSMRATGLEDGEYELGGLPVTVKGKRATGADGTLAGSVNNLMDCVRTAVLEMAIPLEVAVGCGTINPARSIGVDDKYGSLAAGKKADIVLLDKDLEIVKIIKNGKIVIKK